MRMSTHEQTHPQVHPEQPEQAPKKLSTFLKVSIILLAALTIASIALVFMGDFDGKFERVFSTFCLFAVFVTLTAIDTSRDRRSEWYAPVALISNAYILGLLLLVIWMTPYDPFLLGWEIFWKSLLVIVVVRLVILGAELLLRIGNGLPSSVTSFAFIASVLGVLSGILFTAPVGIEAFQITIPELYWKIATATLILTALAIAITTLLRWSYGSDERAQKRAERLAGRGSAYTPQPYHAGTQDYVSQQQYPQQHVQTQHQVQQSAQAQPSVQPQYPVQGQQPVHAGTVAPQGPAESAQPTVGQTQPQAEAQTPPPAEPQPSAVSEDTTHIPALQEDEELLPWPTFEDGSPLPMGPDGQPDFSVLENRPPSE